MVSKDSNLTQETLKSIIRYDPGGGHFYQIHGKRKEDDKGRLRATKKGSFMIKIFQKQYPAQHLAWLYMKGELPQQGRHVGFENGDNTDFRFCNLKLMSRTRIGVGRKTKNKGKTLPGTIYEPVTTKGWPRDLKWRAKVKVNGKHQYLGFFIDEKSAAFAYNRAVEEIKTKGQLTVCTQKIRKVITVNIFDK